MAKKQNQGAKKKVKLPKEIEAFLAAYEKWFAEYTKAQAADDIGSNPGTPPPPPPGTKP